jgi:hypothetical protein
MSDTTTPPARRGRPKIDKPHTRVSTWVEVKHYDQLVRLANQRDQSVSALVRDMIRLKYR